MRYDKSFLMIFVFFASFPVLFLLLPLFELLWDTGAKGVFHALSDPEVMHSILLTLQTALIAVGITALTGIPLAYLIVRYDFPGKSILEALLDIPVMVPHTAAGIALLLTFGHGIPADLLAWLGLKLIDTTTGIVAAMMFLSAPFLINGAKEGFRKLDPKYESVARTLGASKMQTFLSIALPNAKSDIINGALMMWSRGLGEFGAVVILAYHPMVAPVLIYDRFNSFGLHYSAPVAAAMITVSVILFFSVRFIQNKFYT
jgi:molybdate/tungstate transport system permease protein